MYARIMRRDQYERAQRRGHVSGHRLLMRMEKIFGVTDLKAIPAETKLSELGLDSLVAVELKQTLEREREISITKEHLQLMTVDDLLAIDARTFHTSKFRTCEKNQEIYVPFKLNKTCLVSLKSRPSDRNAFIVHGSDGGCDNFKPLASRLHVNVYGLQFTGRDGWNSIPELASQYALKIKEKQPTGPYTIIGYSGGTAIAFEIAQKLKELKEIVQNLIFLDGCPSFEKSNITRTFLLDMLNSWDVLRNVPQDSIKSFESALTGDADNDFLEVLKVLKLATGYELAHGEVDAYAYLIKQFASHSPGEQYQGDIVLIQAMDLSVNIFTPKEDYGVSEFCAGKVIRRKVRGNHFTFLHEDNVGEAASFVNEILD